MPSFPVNSSPRYPVFDLDLKDFPMPSNAVVEADAIKKVELGGVQEVKAVQRKQQSSRLVTKLPPEIHCEIFDHLHPAGQRLLATTCLSFFATYKEGKDYHQKEIMISISELRGSEQYGEILSNCSIHSRMSISNCPSKKTIEGIAGGGRTPLDA
ncbi:uncharacterized protein PAC_14382 [Phialocephala subalpina]|uniref:F-box domain-containing protein n=1 Tax=Phialocephala subalpina TaxID=576137 RepID=A0A1L7XHI1_9HELO|nr:uncharacterized protein PAC_14382 [Phialocephala subalpina]